LDDLEEARRFWNVKEKHYIGLSGEIAFEETINLS
jgi:hypothetical protein